MINFLWGFVLFVAVAALPAAELSGHISDSAHLLAGESKWIGTCEAGLADFEKATGIKLLMRFHPASPSVEEDRKPGAYMRALANELGVARHGVLVVYFNDDPDWRVWIGDELAKDFTDLPGTVQNLTASGAIHDVKEAMLLAASAKAKADIVRAEKSTPVGGALTPAQRLIFEADALLAALKAKFARK